MNVLDYCTLEVKEPLETFEIKDGAKTLDRIPACAGWYYIKGFSEDRLYAWVVPGITRTGELIRKPNFMFKAPVKIMSPVHPTDIKWARRQAAMASLVLEELLMGRRV